MAQIQIHTFRDLKRGLASVAIQAQSRGLFANNPEMMEANDKAVKLFTNPAAVFAKGPDGVLRNYTTIALLRISRYLYLNGINWPLIDWQALLDWLYENWDKVLRVLFTILPLILL